MPWIPDRYRALRDLIRGEHIADDVAEEFEHHVAARTAENVAAGMAPAEARADALRRFGRMDAYSRATREIDEDLSRDRRRTEYLDAVRRELRQAIRSLARSPAFSIVALITLALGIGATTAIYTVLDAVVLNPLPYAEPDRLVRIDYRVPGVAPDATWDLAPAGYFYYRDSSRTLDALGVYRTATMNLVATNGPAERARVAMATPELLRVLRARAHLGRLLLDDDDRPRAGAGGVLPGPASPVVVIGYDYWRTRFAGDSGVVGSTIRVDDVAVPVVGVLEKGFSLPDASIDLWMPLGLNPLAKATSWHQFASIGRLRDGTPIEAAQAELASITQTQFPEAFPNVYGGSFMRDIGFAVQVVPLRDDVVGGIAGLLWVLFGSVALVLLIACANVANLFLVRLDARKREMALRAALGAERGHLAWHYLAESGVLTLAAAACGLGLAWWGISALLAIAPAEIPRLDAVRVGWSAVLFALGVAVVAGVVFGLVPVVRRHLDLGLLREGGRGLTSSRRQHAVRNALVVSQVAFALVLLAAAGLMVRSFVRLKGVEPGIVPDGVLTLQLSLPRARYDTHEKVSAFYQELARRTGGLPGVQSAGFTTALPFTSEIGCSAIFLEDRPPVPDEEPPCVGTARLTPGYFETLGIPVRGRVPDWNDNDRQSGAVVVSRALANRLWPGEDPMGKGLRPNGWGEPFYHVVGVSSDVRALGLDQPPAEAVFYPVTLMEGTRGWEPPNAMSMVVKTETDAPLSLTPQIRAILTAMDPEVPVGEVRSMDDVMAASLSRLSFTMLLLGLAAGMALLLSAVGIYGVISYVTGQRRAEMGIRIALGAPAHRVARQVVAHSVAVALVGVALGLLGAVAVTRVLRSLLFEVSPTDAWTFGLAASTLLLVAAVASAVPAMRAARVDPVESLRAD